MLVGIYRTRAFPSAAATLCRSSIRKAKRSCVRIVESLPHLRRNRTPDRQRIEGGNCRSRASCAKLEAPHKCLLHKRVLPCSLFLYSIHPEHRCRNQGRGSNFDRNLLTLRSYFSSHFFSCPYTCPPPRCDSVRGATHHHPPRARAPCRCMRLPSAH